MISRVVVIAALCIVLAGCTVGGGENECPDNAGCVASNDEPVPNGIGKRVEAACRTLGRSDYGGKIVAERDGGRVEPGHVITQDPKPGFRGGYGQGVNLTVSEPFREETVEFGDRCIDARSG